jgi:hypothetical protein
LYNRSSKWTAWKEMPASIREKYEQRDENNGWPGRGEGTLFPVGKASCLKARDATNKGVLSDHTTRGADLESGN